MIPAMPVTALCSARRALRLVPVLLTLFSAGCFSQRSFPLSPEEFVPATPLAGDGLTTREWLRRTHSQLKSLLPPGDPPALLTDELTAVDNRGHRHAADVFAHFQRDPDKLNSIWTNWSGIQDTAQCAGGDSDGTAPPTWPGFEDRWIPVGALELCARVGFAKDRGGARRAPAVIVLPGLLGDNQVWRTRDICLALRDHGVHAIALEIRGYGQTGQRYPDLYSTFGVLESYDLLAVAAEAKRWPEVTEVGAIGFCWGANQALLAAWVAAGAPNQHGELDRLRPWLPDIGAPPHTLLRAGVIAFSPVLRFDEIVADCERPWQLTENPLLNRLQTGIQARMIQKRHRDVSGSLADLIRFEFERSELTYPGSVEDGYAFLRFLPYRDMPAINRLSGVTSPALIVQAANDPLTSAQNVADLLVAVDNPQVAAIVLPGGGHIGFAAYARKYFYSLILNFFAPQP